MTDVPTHLNRLRQGSEAHARLIEQTAEAILTEARQQYEETMQLAKQVREAGILHEQEIHERFLKNAPPVQKSDGGGVYGSPMAAAQQATPIPPPGTVRQ